MSSNLPRLVHLDLKGGVPRMPYLLSILPMLKECGGTGILVEYENVFPYWDRYSVLAAPWAYTKDEIIQLREACDRLSLEIIPLIQTFGHAEFILQHREFSHVREHSDHPNCFCPSNKESLSIIDGMLAQVLDLHPDIVHFHIGCDEVAPIGVCPSCCERMATTHCDREQLFLDHVCEVALIVKRYRQDLKVIIWDDMIRRLPLDRLEKSDLRGLVEPMVWYYGTESVPDVFGTYAPLFPRVWCASAFKGASGCAQTLPNLALHIGNTKLWFSVIQDVTSKGVPIAGIALTGWSRYDHYGVLCELLPAGLPSLVVCLQILSSTDGWNELVHLRASKLLGINELMPIDWQPRPRPIIASLRFPGESIFVGSQIQANLYQRFIEFVNCDLYRGWFNNYNTSRGYVNVSTILQLAGEAETLLNEFSRLKTVILPSLREIFPQSDVDEWTGEHIDVFVKKLEKVIEKIKNTLQSRS